MSLILQIQEREETLNHLKQSFWIFCRLHSQYSIILIFECYFINRLKVHWSTAFSSWNLTFVSNCLCGFTLRQWTVVWYFKSWKKMASVTIHISQHSDFDNSRVGIIPFQQKRVSLNAYIVLIYFWIFLFVSFFSIETNQQWSTSNPERLLSQRIPQQMQKCKFNKKNYRINCLVMFWFIEMC